MTHPLDDLLDQTHDALLAGDLGRLGQLAPQVEAADPATLDAGTARRLQRKARRNARLLQAALRGIRAARGRLDAISGGSTLTTYDALGRKATLPVTSPAAARRV